MGELEGNKDWWWELTVSIYSPLGALRDIASILAGRNGLGWRVVVSEGSLGSWIVLLVQFWQKMGGLGRTLDLIDALIS